MQATDVRRVCKGRGEDGKKGTSSQKYGCPADKTFYVWPTYKTEKTSNSGMFLDYIDNLMHAQMNKSMNKTFQRGHIDSCCQPV